MRLIQIIKSDNSFSTKKFLFWYETKMGRKIRHMVSNIGYWMMKMGRKMIGFGGNRCSWCGKIHDFGMSASGKGFRCMTPRDSCDKMP